MMPRVLLNTSLSVAVTSLLFSISMPSRFPCVVFLVIATWSLPVQRRIHRSVRASLCAHGAVVRAHREQAI
jgi:hypothetical protein